MPCSKLEMLRARVGDVSRDAALVMPRVGDVSRVLRALEKGPFDVTFFTCATCAVSFVFAFAFAFAFDTATR